MIQTKKFRIVRWQEKYKLLNTRSLPNDLDFQNQALWSKGMDDTPLWQKINNAILDREDRHHLTNSAESDRFMKENRLDLFSWVEDTNLEDRNFRHRFASAWGYIYIEEKGAMDLDVLMGGTHVNLISNIKESTITDLLTSQLPRLNPQFGYFTKVHLDNIAITMPNPCKFINQDIADIVQSKLWGAEITKNGLRFHLLTVDNIIQRERLIRKRFFDIYKLATVAEQFTNCKATVNAYLERFHSDQFQFHEEVLMDVFQHVLAYKAERSLLKLTAEDNILDV